jgi:hypothetical protein
MPEYVLDTSGHVGGQRREANDGSWFIEPFNMRWTDLDAFTQGYIEALFFTENDYGGDDESFDPENGSALPHDAAFADLAPEALLAILKDCAAFQANGKWKAWDANRVDCPDVAQDGRDFWYTRNGHGCGFWDGDYPEPYATELSNLAGGFGEVNAYLGDDGKIYIG